MSLSDPKYLLFLAIVVLLFYVVRGARPRAAVLLAASYGFYCNLSGYYTMVLVFVTTVAYAGGILLSSSRQAHRRGLLFALSCVVLLAPLIVFKYLGFLLGVAASLVSLRSEAVSPVLTLILPIGISFFTFAALGYLVDVYLEVIESERRPLEFALFVAFFPLVTAGPIERAGRLLPQFDLGALRFTSERAFAASRLVFLGLFLKVVCADILVKPIDAIYGDPRSIIPIEKLFGLIYYMFYVYADFAGYSLIAIGSAAFFGLEVRPNFQQPFLSTTVPEFWRNWHISLSSWVRDYLFTPLRMHWRRRATGGMIAALMISFLVLGVWHGAGWGFALFGLMHGLLVIGSTLTLKYRDAAWSWVGMPGPVVHAGRMVWTFIFVMLTFVVYRANSLRDAAHIYRELFSIDLLRNAWYGAKLQIFFRREPVAFQFISFTSWTWVIVGLVIAGDVLARRSFTLEKMAAPVQIVIYNIGVVLIVYGWIANSAAQPFLYYRF